MEDDNCFTIVFKGDIRKLNRNPFKIESEFGEVVAVGVGNSFTEVDELTEELEALMSETREWR